MADPLRPVQQKTYTQSRRREREGGGLDRFAESRAVGHDRCVGLHGVLA